MTLNYSEGSESDEYSCHLWLSLDQKKVDLNVVKFRRVFKSPVTRVWVWLIRARCQNLTQNFKNTQTDRQTRSRRHTFTHRHQRALMNSWLAPQSFPNIHFQHRRSCRQNRHHHACVCVSVFLRIISICETPKKNSSLVFRKRLQCFAMFANDGLNPGNNCRTGARTKRRVERIYIHKRVTSPIKGFSVFSGEIVQVRQRRFISTPNVSERHQVKWDHHGNTPEMCWQMGKICSPAPSVSLSHTYIQSGCQKYSLKERKHKKLPGARVQRSTATNCLDSDEVLGCRTANLGDSGISKAIMDMSGSILLWQRLCNGELRPDLTIDKK